MCNAADADLARRGRYKRGFDLAVIGIALVLLLPFWVTLLLVIPLAIWLEDRGPVFFVQTRAGLMGRTFSILKFRTLRPLAGNELVAPKDNRLTRVGALLRKFYLDELPQVVNILHGDMSLVGPRPEWWPRHLEICQHLPEFDRRLRVRPGIAGLAQIRGTYWSSAKEKLRYDNLYIDTFNAWLDVKLLCLAVLTAVSRWFKPEMPKQRFNGGPLTPSPTTPFPTPPPPPRATPQPSARGRQRRRTNQTESLT